MYKILVVEDDRAIADAITTLLTAWDMNAHTASNFRNILGEFSSFEPHLILLDIRLPFYNGYHWCQEIRRVSKVPIIFI
ncbi:MAG: response regulator, partial [Bacteroidaceae bacterium]|nr:response regulator [Bacteroidaceae bacterium]